VTDTRNVRMSNVEIDKTTDEVMISSGILKRNTICGTNTSVKLHRGVHRVVISETDTINKVMNLLSLGEVVVVSCGCDHYLKKVAKRTQVRHVKLLTKMSPNLNKDNMVRIIPMMSISST
jgi:hypothetical protein